MALESGGAFLEAAESLAERQRTSVDDVLRQFAGVAHDVIGRVDGQQTPGLTTSEVDVLLRSGGIAAEQLQHAQSWVEQGEWTAALLQTALHDTVDSLTTQQVGAVLHLTPSAVRHRLGKRTLWSFAVGGEHRLPLWQFVGSSEEPGQLSLLPGLPRLLRAIPATASPSEINAVMTTPQPALEIDGTPVTITQWILAGEDLEAAVEVLRTITTVW